ncbi:MAG: DUF1415 domain-containing protein [Rhodocyclaceae bacterium]|nr:DUF1415 domain-containing protein [Rhodocyclaceae bacterium]
MTEALPPDAEIVAATRTWLERAVIGLNLCPFAKSVHVKQQIRYAVVPIGTYQELLEALERELRLLADTDPVVIETTLLIHPLALTEFLDYGWFLPLAERVLEDLGLVGEIQIAHFHPQFQFSDCGPDDIENFTNRSPYATLHLIRESSIDRAVAAFPDAAEIFDKNIETLRRMGHEGWRRLWLETSK